MKDFHFVKSGVGQGSRTDKLQDTIRLTSTQISIGQKVYENLGKPARIEVFHDAAAKALRLEAATSSIDGYAVGIRRDTKMGRVKLKTSRPQQYIPLGEYLPISNNIFVHESVQR